MIISKATAVWGDGADEATLAIEIVGNTPDEVKHLESLKEEPMTVAVTCADGALHFVAHFKREVSLAVQQQQKADEAAADHIAATQREAEADKRSADAQDAAMRETIAERCAQIVADRIQPATAK